jgi:hypothetical protein
MFYSPTLTEREATLLRAALANANEALENLKEVIASELYSKLAKAVALIKANMPAERHRALTSEQFKHIHNGKCELNFALERLQGIVSESRAEPLKAVLQGFKDALKGAYQQESAAFEAKNAMFSAISEEHDLKSCWSIYEVKDMAQVPFPNANSVVYDEHFGDNPVQVDIVNASWVDLWKAADRLINISGDNHHVFIEAFTPKKGDPTTLQLSCGS